MVQFGGQAGPDLADARAAGGTRILGSTVDTIDLAEDRRRCEALLRDHGIPQSPGGSATNAEMALAIAARVGYPVLVRPSYVLGGRGMEIVHSAMDLRRYVEAAIGFGVRGPILVDKYLLGRELDVDAVCDGETVVPMVNLATHAALGRSLTEFGFAGGLQASRPLYAVKAPVFSMAKLPAVDAVLGPEMKSTGEAMGIAQDLPTAQYKAFLSTMQELPPDGAALCSIADADKEEALPILRALHGLGIRLYATAGTAAFLSESAIPATTVQKLRDGHPNVVDVIRSGQVQLVVNTVSSSAPLARNGGVAPLRDGYEIRRASVERRIPCLTSLDTDRKSVV